MTLHLDVHLQVFGWMSHIDYKESLFYSDIFLTVLRQLLAKEKYR